MPLHKIDPTTTVAWSKLKEHFETIKDTTIDEFFRKEPLRSELFNVELNSLSLDYSKNRLDSKTLELLLSFAKEMKLEESIEKLFKGNLINETENRAVLHTALRSSEDVYFEGKNIRPDIESVLTDIKQYSDNIINGNIKGYTGKNITDIVNIGIGGSDLGPQIVIDSLRFYKNHIKTHFISNIDGDYIYDLLNEINPETTLFIVVSKTFKTQETMANAKSIRKWFIGLLGKEAVNTHFIAVSANKEEVNKFGIEKTFPIWDWVGGRFSMWSAVGLSISLSIGFDNFNKMLEGANYMDKHFRQTPFKNNIPVLLSLISIWYNNFFDTDSELVLPYSQYLERLPIYLQQISMESNGKSIDRTGHKVSYQTGNIVWGGAGTNAQHAFMQLLHQGTKIIPTDFIGFKNSLHQFNDHHRELMSNYNAQIKALTYGKNKQEAYLDLKLKKENTNLLPHKIFEGNKPTNNIMIDKLTPYTLGMLLAMYEHKVFVQGVLWNIFSFDQFGVELGKELAYRSEPDIV